MNYYFIFLSIILLLFYYLIIHNTKIEYLSDSECKECHKNLSTDILTTLVSKLESQSKVNSENIDKLLKNINVNNKKIRVLEESSEEMNQVFNIAESID